MSLEQISLTNSRIRLALKAGDSNTMIESTLRLCNNNQEKADKLERWFNKVAKNCKENKKVTVNMSMMRMWQLGNADIQEITDEGDPIFILTVSGTEKIKSTPKLDWFKVLLWESDTQLAKGR